MINTAPFIITNINRSNSYESKQRSNYSNKSDIAPYTPMYMADPQAFTEQLFKNLGYDSIPEYIQKNLDKLKEKNKMNENNIWCLNNDEIQELIKKCLDQKIKTMDNDISRNIVESVNLVIQQIKELHKHIFKQTTIKIPFKWPIVPITIYKDKFGNLGKKQMFQMAMSDEEFYWYETAVNEGGELTDDAALLLLRTLIELKSYCLAIANEVGLRYDKIEEEEENKDIELPGEKDKHQIKEWLYELKSIVCHIQMNSSNDEIGTALKKGWINHQNHLINKLVIYQECPPNTKCWYIGYGPSPSYLQCCDCWRKNINNIVEKEIKEVN